MVSRIVKAGLVALMMAASLAAQPAAALSFSIPVGRVVADIDLSTSGGLTYDGTSETLTISTDVDEIRLDDNSVVGLSPGQLVFSLSVSLVGVVTTTPIGFDTLHEADLSNGAYDFSIIDTQNTASVLDDELVLGADFTGDLHLLIQESFFGTTGDLGGGSQAGEFTITWLAAALAGQVPLAGDLSAILTNFAPSTGLADGGGGFVDYTAQPNVDVNFTVPVPEAGVGWLLLSTAVAIAGASRIRI
jgi:hypothetical protein